MIAVVALATACDDESGGDAGMPDAGMTDAGPGCTEVLWTPEADTLQRWPEPALVVDDPSTETGVRLFFDEARYGTLTARLRGYRQVFTEDLGELDGFGVSAEAFFVFGRAFDPGALPALEDTGAPGAPLGFVVVDETPPRLVRAVVDTTDDDRTILLAPDRPLPARATVAAYVTTGLLPATDGCLRASDAQRAALESPDARTAAALDALTELGVIASADDLVALTAFPTQSIEEDTVAVAEDVAARAAPGFVAPPTCVDETRWIRCDAAFVAQDYRDADGVFRRDGGQPATPVTSYEVPVTFWLPPGATPPYPTLLFGHGLAGDRNQARRLAEFAAPLGLATVSAPALMHGEHPTNPDPMAEQLNVVLGFFAVGEDLNDRAVHATRLRDHFRQTTWDRLQLTTLLETSPDVDGDGAADVDPDQLAYLGVSLGGLMGPELMAATDTYSAGVLAVPGGRVSTIISDSGLFSALIDLLRPRGTTEGDVRRFFPILQTVLDSGDPAAYGPHVLESRLASAPDTPSVLVGVVLDDDVVPNIANYALGRALGVPIVAPVRRPEPGFEVVDGPIMGNYAGGAATGGLLQFDYVDDGGMVVPATHNNIGDSDVGAEAWFDFLDTHLAGLARIRDPYEAIGFPRP